MNTQYTNKSRYLCKENFPLVFSSAYYLLYPITCTSSTSTGESRIAIFFNIFANSADN